MTIHVARQDGLLCLRIDCGKALDAHSAPEVKRAAQDLIDGRCDVAVDLSEIVFIDSAGVSALVGLYKHAHGQGSRLCFVGVGEEVRTVLKMIKLDRILELHPDAVSVARALATTDQEG